MFVEQIYIYYTIRPAILHFNEFDFRSNYTTRQRSKDGTQTLWYVILYENSLKHIIAPNHASRPA